MKYILNYIPKEYIILLRGDSIMELYEKTIKSENIYKGMLDIKLDTVKLPNGKISTREVIKHPGAVCIAAINHNKKLTFVKQYRHACSKVILELPAGKLDNNENPLNAAIRELKEETGIVGKNFKYLGGMYVSPGYSDEIIHLYVCEVESKADNLNLDDDEFLEPIQISLNDAVNMVLKNEIDDSKTQILILKIFILMSDKSHNFNL